MENHALRIAIDLSQPWPGQADFADFDRFLRQIIVVMLSMPEARKHHFTIYLDNEQQLTSKKYNNVVYKVKPAKGQGWLSRLRWHQTLVKEKFDVIHYGYPNSVKGQRNSRTIVISPDSHALPLAVDKQYQKIDNHGLLPRMRSAYHLQKSYLLCDDPWVTHEEVLDLIDAFASVYTRRRNISLVIVGEVGLLPEVATAISYHRLQQAVIVLADVAVNDQPALYSAAEAVIIPSTKEGFSRVFLHAFASESPIICSTTTQRVKLYDDAALYFNSGDIVNIADTILMVLKKPEIRAILTKAGKAKLAEYNPDIAATKLLQLYTNRT